jgi:hypothetical protein
MSSRNIFKNSTYAKWDPNNSFTNDNLNRSKNRSYLNRSDLENNFEKAEKGQSDKPDKTDKPDKNDKFDKSDFANKYFSRSNYSSRKSLLNLNANSTPSSNKIFFEKVDEESNNLIDEKLRKIISRHKMKEDVQKMSKRGSLLSLLKFAIGSNIVFLNTGNFKNPNHKYENQNSSQTKNESFATGSFDICREYIRYLN